MNLGTLFSALIQLKSLSVACDALSVTLVEVSPIIWKHIAAFKMYVIALSSFWVRCTVLLRGSPKWTSYEILCHAANSVTCHISFRLICIHPPYYLILPHWYPPFWQSMLTLVYFSIPPWSPLILSEATQSYFIWSRHVNSFPVWSCPEVTGLLLRFLRMESSRSMPLKIIYKFLQLNGIQTTS